MTTSPRAALVILNAASGGGQSADIEAAVSARLGAAGMSVRFVALIDGVDLAAEVARAVAQGVSLVVAAGGDGTVNAVVNAMHPSHVPLGILPLGTLNHFARDLGIPVDLEPALDVLLEGSVMAVDAAEVNGRLFVNNASVGLYPRIVRLRARFEGPRLGKWLVAAWATWRVTRTGRAMRVQLTADGVAVSRTTPLVFVGNNAYRMAGFDAGSRESLQGAALAVYVVRTSGRWNLLRLVWRILARTAKASGELAMVHTATATIDVPDDAVTRRLEVAMDGEVTFLDLPLTFRSLPGALSVCSPR
jgi:YegS/Rv2252/BmrU family lipid kinase